MRTIKCLLLVLLAYFQVSHAQENADNSPILVGISETQKFVDINHQGSLVRVRRIQDQENKLSGDFTKTSRACPPFCIQPFTAAPGVETIGELELFEFIKGPVNGGRGILIDARTPKFYNSETIPGAVNIPFVIFTSSIEQILPLLGAEKQGNNWYFDRALSLLLFCNGPWCAQSPRAITALVEAGYPTEKIKNYRGGMQLWKNFGLTTVRPVANNAEG